MAVLELDLERGARKCFDDAADQAQRVFFGDGGQGLAALLAAAALASARRGNGNSFEGSRVRCEGAFAPGAGFARAAAPAEPSSTRTPRPRKGTPSTRRVSRAVSCSPALSCSEWSESQPASPGITSSTEASRPRQAAAARLYQRLLGGGVMRAPRPAYLGSLAGRGRRPGSGAAAAPVEMDGAPAAVVEDLLEVRRSEPRGQLSKLVRFDHGIAYPDSARFARRIPA